METGVLIAIIGGVATVLAAIAGSILKKEKAKSSGSNIQPAQPVQSIQSIQAGQVIIQQTAEPQAQNHPQAQPSKPDPGLFSSPAPPSQSQTQNQAQPSKSDPDLFSSPDPPSQSQTQTQAQTRAQNQSQVQSHAPISQETTSEGKANSSDPNNGHFIRLSDYSLPYIPILSSWDADENEFYSGNILTTTVEANYTVPEIFLDDASQSERDALRIRDFEGKVRLEFYNVKAVGIMKQLQLQFSKIKYSDYILTSRVLDKLLPGSENETYRARYCDPEASLNPLLSNICGVGLFILSSDGKIIVQKASESVYVSPNCFAFSASGTMDFGVETHPAYDAIRECKEEIGYKPSIENIVMYSFGFDYKKAYYQFCFFEKSDLSARKIIENSHMARDYTAEVSSLHILDFEPESLVRHIKGHEWDTTAAAALLTLLSKHFGKSRLEHMINAHYKREQQREEMVNEWRRRARRPGELAVLSTRFPSIQIKAISKSYVSEVQSFIEEDLRERKENFSEKSVLDVGGGIGLFTKYFAQHARFVTCVDLSAEMLERNKASLGFPLQNKVEYVNCFFQDFVGKREYDFIFCSLVLVHNTNETELLKIIQNMKKSAKTIYLFETIGKGLQNNNVSSQARSREEYIALFDDYHLSKEREYMLSVDRVLFMKFELIRY